MSEWKLQPHAGPGPFHVERCCHVWMIANPQHVNVAHTDSGAVLFQTRERAEQVLSEVAG